MIIDCFNILIVILIIITVLFIWGLTKMLQSNATINKKVITKEPIKFTSDKLPLSRKNGGIQWSFVLCLYINDWQYKYGSDKMVFDWVNSNKNGVKCYFDYKNNNLNLDITTIPNMKYENIVVENIPVQKWISIIITLEDRNLDIFLDGELVKTKLLDFVPFYRENDFKLFDNGGFDGILAYFQYFNYRLELPFIKHFSNLKDTMTNSLPIYSPLYYTLSYIYKNIFNTIITIINRIFRLFNILLIDSLVYIVELIKYLGFEIYRLIFFFI